MVAINPQVTYVQPRSWFFKISGENNEINRSSFIHYVGIVSTQIAACRNQLSKALDGDGNLVDSKLLPALGFIESIEESFMQEVNAVGRFESLIDDALVWRVGVEGIKNFNDLESRISTLKTEIEFLKNEIQRLRSFTGASS
jgi:hypothetical protein